jgi:hypothetical protein
MTTSRPTGSFHVFDDFRRHSAENVDNCDPLETLSAGFEVPTSYFGNLKLVALVQLSLAAI